MFVVNCQFWTFSRTFIFNGTHVTAVKKVLKHWVPIIQMFCQYIYIQFQTIILGGHLTKIIFFSSEANRVFVYFFLFIWSYFFAMRAFSLTMTRPAIGQLLVSFCFCLSVIFVCCFQTDVMELSGDVGRIGRLVLLCFASCTGRPPVSSLPCWKKLLLVHNHFVLFIDYLPFFVRCLGADRRCGRLVLHLALVGHQSLPCLAGRNSITQVTVRLRIALYVYLEHMSFHQPL